MSIPKRVLNAAGRYSLVDGIPFKLPVTCEKSPVLMAAFPINAEKAQALMPGNEIFPLKVWNRGLLVITVVNYRITTIGKYIEYSIAIACTHGSKTAPRLLPALFMKSYDTGQYVYDLPVSTEISVKGGKGIWGMPKHQASLNFIIADKSVSAQYDCDGQFAMKIEIDRPRKTWLPINLGAINFCEFRGMLFKSYIYFRGEVGLELFGKARATLTIGDHPRVRALKTLEIDPKPIFTAFIAEANGVLDDHCESWFVSYPQPPTVQPEGLESVVNLGLSQEWPPPPKAQP
jgi:Acetoacetate decarboxylase (ADC)